MLINYFTLVTVIVCKKMSSIKNEIVILYKAITIPPVSNVLIKLSIKFNSKN